MDLSSSIIDEKAVIVANANYTGHTLLDCFSSTNPFSPKWKAISYNYLDFIHTADKDGIFPTKNKEWNP